MAELTEEHRLLRIGLDGQWEVAEFSKCFRALDRLYLTRFNLSIESEDLREFQRYYMEPPFLPQPTWYFRRWAKYGPAFFLSGERALLRTSKEARAALSELLEPQERLVVHRIIYGSPGIQDVVGIGEIVGHLKDLLVQALDYFSTRRQRDLENNRRELENVQLQIQIARDFVGLARELRYTKKEMRQLVASVVREQKPIIQLIGEGKITSADLIDDESHSS